MPLHLPDRLVSWQASRSFRPPPPVLRRFVAPVRTRRSPVDDKSLITERRATASIAGTEPRRNSSEGWAWGAALPPLRDGVRTSLGWFGVSRIQKRQGVALHRTTPCPWCRWFCRDATDKRQKGRGNFLPALGLASQQIKDSRFKIQNSRFNILTPDS